MTYKSHILSENESVKSALVKLDELAQDAVLFTVNEKGALTGSLTDGDVRRGLMKGVTINDKVSLVSFKTPRFLDAQDLDIRKLISFRNEGLTIVPILDKYGLIVDILNARLRKSILPIDVVIMAGGKGKRLRPLTNVTPKPLLKLGSMSILEHNMRRFESYGVNKIHISTNYFADKIEAFVYEVNSSFTAEIQTVREESFLGTIGAVRLIKEFNHEHILVSNSDLLTNVDYEAFYLDFIEQGADMSVVSIPYHVEIPYAIMDIKNDYLQSFHEKPRYTYFSNGGIYLLKKELLDYIPYDKPYSATDLMQEVILKNGKIRTYAHQGYWLDIGRHEDFKKAQEDIKTFKF